MLTFPRASQVGFAAARDSGAAMPARHPSRFGPEEASRISHSRRRCDELPRLLLPWDTQLLPLPAGGPLRTGFLIRFLPATL